MPRSEQAPGAVPELVATAEIARRAGVDVATVNRWAKQGRIAVAMRGPGKRGANFYHRADAEAFLDSLPRIAQVAS